MKPTLPNRSKSLLKRSGFTLIELMVVISIIALLSSIILASLKTARTKGQEAVVIGELTQFRNLYEIAYSTYGNYASLQPSPGTFNTCNYYNVSGSTGYICTATSLPGCLSIYGTNGQDLNNNSSALALCQQILNDAGSFSIGLATTSNQQYSLWAFLPSQQKYMCFGSSKNNSSTTSSPIYNSLASQLPGCPANP